MSKAIYVSKYTDRGVTAAQYLTDFIMERIAANDKEILPYKYWYNERWKKVFLAQLTHANKLLSELDCTTIMSVLRSYKGKRIYSLGLRRQILDLVNQVNFHPNGILVPTIEPEDSLSIDETEESQQVKKKENLWTKLL